MTTGREFQTSVARWQAGESLAQAAAALCAALTPEEKLSMLDGDLNFWEGRIRALTLGQSNRTCPAAVIPRLGIPGFDFLDGPRGVGLGSATCFPVSMARGAGFDPALETAIGDAIGKEMRVRGGTLFGGVCINLLRHPAWGRAQETYGEDPHHVGEMGAALSKGVQRHAMACVKHFALNSMETSRHRVDVTCDERALHEVYLQHFRRVVESGVAVVMSAYNSVNGDWCGHSRHLLTEILKEEWGFDGTVITDFIFGIRDATLSLKAGLDIEMPYKMIRWQHMPREIVEGRVTWAEVDATVERILRTLIRFEHLRQQPMPDAAIVAGPAHTGLALQSARQSIVLLENDGVLPLSSTIMKIAVLGRLAIIPNLGDGGSSAVNPPYVVTPLDGITRGFPQAQVTHSEDDATTAKGADLAVIVVGTTMHDEGEFLDLDAQLPMLDLYAPPFESDDQRQRFQFLIENQDTALAEPPGGDRASLKLSAHDQQLILDAAATGVPVVVVMMGGSAFVTEDWRDKASAILHLWYPGMEGGTALADILSGRANPSGHMPFATPVDEGDLPPFALLTDHAEYGLLHGQWLLDMGDHQQVRYPFGHGLSYAEFLPQALTVQAESDGVFAVAHWKNAGAVPGEDVIFIFATVPGSSHLRPQRRLVGFQRIALGAGQTGTATIALDLRQLAIRQDGRWLWEGLPLRLEAARWSGDPQAVAWSGKVESPLS